MRALGLLLSVLLTLLAPASSRAELRIGDLDVYLNDRDVAVRVVVLGALPAGLHEGVRSGVPAHLRLTVEVWQYQRFWRDRLVSSRVVERTLDYNVLTKEYRVTPVRGESRPAYTTRDLDEAQRVLSEVDGLRLVASRRLESDEIFYVRVVADSSLRGEHSLLTRMTGTAERTRRRSDYRTISRAD